MAFSIIRQGDTDQYDVMSYCCDKLEDVAALPTEVGPGSSCIVIEDSSVWMLDSNGVWNEL